MSLREFEELLSRILELVAWAILNKGSLVLILQSLATDYEHKVALKWKLCNSKTSKNTFEGSSKNSKNKKSRFYSGFMCSSQFCKPGSVEFYLHKTLLLFI